MFSNLAITVCDSPGTYEPAKTNSLKLTTGAFAVTLNVDSHVSLPSEHVILNSTFSWSGTFGATENANSLLSDTTSLPAIEAIVAVASEIVTYSDSEESVTVTFDVGSLPTFLMSKLRVIFSAQSI